MVVVEAAAALPRAPRRASAPTSPNPSCVSLGFFGSQLLLSLQNPPPLMSGAWQGKLWLRPQGSPQPMTDTEAGKTILPTSKRNHLDAVGTPEPPCGHGQTTPLFLLSLPCKALPGEYPC